ncbi:MAG: SMC-Scp complex subunit ScpB, partial [Calditrichaeota bacterium]|nr:SMC-Scp complex subunit ScpB [Calditrichota bacterium]
RNLITMAGRASTVGRPVLYKTTEHFLAYFGINSLADLPSLEEVEALLKARAPREEAEPTAGEVDVEVVSPGEIRVDQGKDDDGEAQ